MSETTWGTEPPKEPGWYWVRRAGSPVRVVQVADAFDPSDRSSRPVVIGLAAEWSPVGREGYEWAGPIRVPGERSKA